VKWSDEIRMATTKRGTRAAATSAVAAAILAWASPSLAQNICVNSPSFVPGLSGPPIWTGAGTVRIDLNDPRWAAATLRRFPQDATGSEAAYRIIKDGQQLSVSIHVITDPTPNANDAVYFGFSESGTVAHLVRLNLPGSGVEPIPITSFHTWDRTAGVWGDTGAAPPIWLKDPRAWRTAAVAPVNPGDPGWEAVKAGVQWAINFKVDLPAGALTTDFRVFAATHVTTGVGSIDYYVPDYPIGTTLVPGTIAPQASDTAWQSVTALNTPCPAGITLSYMNLGTTNASSSTIDTSPGSTNTFFADPSGIAAPVDNKVLAKFRIAHWGATIADPQAPWTDIPGATAVPSSSSGSHTHTFACVPSGGGTCPVLGAGEDPHQCMLVELKAGPSAPAGMVIETPSAYRNMDFVDLSTSSRQAEINVKGLQAVTGQAKDRDVYLYVKQSNMPAHGDAPLWLPTKRMSAAKKFAETPPPAPPRRDKPPEGKGERVPVKVAPKAQPGKDGKVPPAAPQQPAPGQAEGQAPPPPPSEFGAASAHEALVSSFPTYEVHVYYDTGVVVKIDGQDQRVLRPMVPFGYFLQHDGPLYGFTSAFEAQAGVALQEVSPNFFHVVIPNEGKITVKSTITAEEKPKSGEPGGPAPCPACPPKGGHRCQCDVPGAPVGGGAWLPALLAAIAVVWRRRRSS